MNKSTVNIDEALLVKKCLSDDKSAQKLLYQKYVRAVYSNIIRIVGNKNDAEDLLQETFIKVFSKLNTFKGESTLGAWIKRIAINVGLNHMRSKKNVFWNSIEDEEYRLKEIKEESDDRLPNVKKVHETIKGLPDGCRVVFSLFSLEGYQHKEIAQILNISESTSKSQYQRARKLLQQRLKLMDCYS